MTQIRESDILYETPCNRFWVYANPEKSYFEVYEIGLTHSMRVSCIGKSFGIDRAIDECKRRVELLAKGSKKR